MNKKIKNNFTLVEIAVVLVVLVALAGLVVPKALGYAQRSHGTTGAANMAQLESNINRFEAENFIFPNEWDNLIDPTSSSANAYSSAFGVHALTAGEASALNNAGVTIVHELVDQDGTLANAQLTTFGGTASADASVAATLVVASVAEATVQTVLGNSNDSGNTYVAFGIGETLTAIGKTMVSAPYDFPEGAEKPEDNYRRFIAIFSVPDDADEKAKFVGIVANDDNSLTNIQTHIAEYYEATE